MPPELTTRVRFLATSNSAPLLTRVPGEWSDRLLESHPTGPMRPSHLDILPTLDPWIQR